MRNTITVIMFISACLIMLPAVPPFQNPDEPAHLAYTMKFASGRHHPEELEKQILDALRIHRFWNLVQFPEPPASARRFFEVPLLRTKPTQVSKPSLYYQAGGLLLRMFHVEHPLNSMYLMRALSVALSILNILLFAKIISSFGFSEPVRNAALAMVLNPQFVCMSTAVNPATLGWLAASMIIWGALQLPETSRRFSATGWISAGTILGLFGHRIALSVLPAVIPAAILICTRNLRKPKHGTGLKWWQHFLMSSILLGAAIAFVLIYPDIVRKVAFRIISLGGELGFKVAPPALSIGWWLHFFVLFHKSTWLAFGWLRMYGDPWIYQWIAAAAVAATAGMGIRMLGMNRADISALYKLKFWTALFAILGNLWAGAIVFALRGELSQGRYLFAAWPAIAAFIAAGLMVWIPARWQPGVSRLVAVLMIMFFLYSLWGVLIPQGYL